jgi:hypothetical protein
MKLLEDGLLLLLKPRVVHSMPGRLRLHVPSLKRMKQEGSELLPLLTELLLVPDGMLEVTPSLTTGNILFLYDRDRLSEREILQLIHSITRIVQAHRNDVENLFRRDHHQAAERLNRWLSEALETRICLDEQLRIPDDVFR